MIHPLLSALSNSPIKAPVFMGSQSKASLLPLPETSLSPLAKDTVLFGTNRKRRKPITMTRSRDIGQPRPVVSTNTNSTPQTLEIHAEPRDPEDLAQALELNRKEFSLMLKAYPGHIQTAIKEQLTQDEQDRVQGIYLNEGMMPEISFYDDDQQKTLTLDRPIKKGDIDAIVQFFKKDNENAFHSTFKNRTGMPDTIHRFSVIRDSAGGISGVTTRVAGDPSKNKLPQELVNIFLGKNNIGIAGEAGCGKTTLLRLAALLKSTTDLTVQPPRQGKRTVIVDNSEEIAGISRVPHRTVGKAVKMPVPYNSSLADVLQEAIQNQEPKVVITDELKRPEEIEAGLAIARESQLICTVHGKSFEDVAANKRINPLLGGTVDVTIKGEEAEARRSANNGRWRKQITQRDSLSALDYLLIFEKKGQIAVYNRLNEKLDDYWEGKPVIPDMRIYL